MDKSNGHRTPMPRIHAAWAALRRFVPAVLAIQAGLIATGWLGEQLWVRRLHFSGGRGSANTLAHADRM